MEVLEGDWIPKRLVILEFPSIAQLKAWYESRNIDPFSDPASNGEVENGYDRRSLKSARRP